MIAYALQGAVLGWALAVLVPCAVLRALYVVGLREQARRANAAQEALQDRRRARDVLRRRDPGRALRLDQVDPL